MSHEKSDKTTSASGLHGLLLELDSPGALVTAAERVRDAGYTRWDTHTPYPVHGIDQAMGLRRTRLPWIVFACGLIGCATGLVLQWWTNATGATEFGFVPTFLQGYDYPISGKPRFSLPANVPVIFELTVLLAALAAVVGMLAMNNLPWHHNPLLGSERFRRVTRDRFFIHVDARDPRFDEQRTRDFLAGLGGTAVDRIPEVVAPTRLPPWLVYTLVTLISLAVLPPLWVAKARVSKSEQPRIHLIQDMDNQARYKTQQAAVIFADGRALRPSPPGTMARGGWPPDAHFDQGQVGDAWAPTFPPQVELRASFVRRGQQRFNIYCTACHGLDGSGNGVVHQRALKLDEGGWIAPTSLTDQTVRDREHGHIFNTITNGIRSMAPYGDQIPVADRWAIVAYVRALQLSQSVPLTDVPADLREDLP